MAKVRYDSEVDSILGHFEWEGTPQELLEIYDGLKKRLDNNLQLANSVTRVYDPSPRLIIKGIHTITAESAELAKKMPTIEQLITYIASKQKFEHDVIEIENKFFERQIKSREHGRTYRELRKRLELARKAMEIKYHGAFERRSGRPRNLQIYSFRLVNAAPLGALSQPQKES
jgi:hypothetical protein